VQGMQVLVDGCPCVGVHRLLVRLKMVDEVQEDAFEAVPFKAFPHYEHCGIGIDCRTHNCVVTLVPKSSNGGIDVKDVGQGFDVRNLLIVCRLIWLDDLGCHCPGVIEDTGTCNASSGYSTFRPEQGRDQLGEVFCVQL